jgi:hypothetical protein
MSQEFGFAPAPHHKAAPRPVPLHRLRRHVAPGHVNHFYTTSLAEHDEAIARYEYESDGVACLVFDSPASGTVPLFRLWHGPSQRHSYTTEGHTLASTLAKRQPRYEGIAGFVYPQAVAGTRPLHALHHPESGAHFYTVSEAEREAAIHERGYEELVS